MNPKAPQFRPAFPVVILDGADVDSGMSLREYFAARAPIEPQSWFHPTLPQRQARDPAWRWCEQCKADSGDCLGNADCEKLRDWRKADCEWDLDAQKSKFIQWPWAWADAVLAAAHTS